MGQITEQLTNILTQLVACPSISPEDAGCQLKMITFLKQLGFRCETYHCSPVHNFYAEYGVGDKLLVFAGHTDVVPTGDQSLWHQDPFSLRIREGIAYGRGVADMKGSLAAMLMTAKRWVTHHPNSGRVGFLITSGEEGDDYAHGTPYVLQQLYKQGHKIDYCIVGEPSSTHSVGDMIKIGRRGSLSAKVLVQGKQGHVAYPHLAKNPIHLAAPALAELTAMHWDEGSEYFPPTSLQITHVHAGGQAGNIIPQDLQIHFNIRFSTIHSVKDLKEKITACFDRHQLKPNIEWILSGEPFLTQTGKLLEACDDVIRKYKQKSPEFSTSGGTSDGRFIAPYGIEVIELGPSNQSIHQINESVSLEDLVLLSEMYYDILCEILS